MPGWIVAIALLALVGIAGWGSWQLWSQMDSVSIGFHGEIALLLGGGGALLLTFFFMLLIYIGHKRGYDDEAGRGWD